MSKDDKIRMPMSSSGVLSYAGETETKLLFKPAHVIIMVFVVIFLLFILNNYGYSLLGIPK